jgi:hypothetical protein
VGGFAINSGAWQTLDPTICYLTEQHRQNDGGYLEVLEALRGNNLRRHHAETLLSRVNANLDNENITELHTTNLDVDDLNYSRLNRIVSKEYTYEMLTTGSENYVDNLKRACLAPEILRLKQGALVVALKNHPSKKYANGSIGVVEEFDKLLGLPIVKFNNGHTVTMSADSWELRDGEKKRASLTQIPLRLAWALTVHKAQGMTLDAARVDLSRAFVPGMGYVALSRVKSLDSLSLAGLNRIALQVAPEATRLDEDFREACRIAVRDLAHLEVGEKERSYDPVSIKKIKLPKDPLVAKEKAARSAAWNEKILKLRKTVPKANMAWTIEESHELMELFLESMSVWELSRHFGRKPVAIMLRLNLSLGAELFAKQDIMDFRNAIKRAPEMAEEVFGAVKLEAK